LRVAARSGAIILIALQRVRTILYEFYYIYTALAIPYNSYEPQPYNRWTFQGMFDSSKEMKVTGEFWDFLGGPNTYQELLKVFEEVGFALRPEIDAKFATFVPKR